MRKKQWTIALKSLVAVLGIGMAGGVLFFVAHPVFAQDIINNAQSVAETAGLSMSDPRIILAKVIRVILGLMGIVLVCLVLYAGWLWMTSKGEAEKTKKAQQIMINAAIGLAIILSALAITQFVLNRLLGAVTGAGGSSGSERGVEVVDRFSSALGAGPVETHFPGRSAQGIARNVKIVITFRDAIDPASIIQNFNPDNPADSTGIDSGSIAISPSANRNDILSEDEVSVSFTPDMKTFVFDPTALLGNSASDVEYEVRLSNDINLASGSSAFVGTSSGGYTWRFTVSTFVDTKPPSVESVIPIRDSTNPRNLLVQVNYSEAVLPTAVVSPTTNIIIRQGDTTLSGGWSIGNQYRTSEFISDVACGTNSCGETIYCLPSNANLEVVLQAAPLAAEPPEAIGPPYAGVVDMYGNSLDGDSDGIAEGNPIDNYSWSFSTNNNVVLTPPKVLSITPPLSGPSGPAEDVALDQQVSILFDTLLSAASLTSSNFIFHSPSESLWFAVSGAAENPSGSPTTAPIIGTDRTRVTVGHGLLSEDIIYGAEAKSTVRSVLQNCFTPSSSQSCAGPNCCDDDARTALCTY